MRSPPSLRALIELLDSLPATEVLAASAPGPAEPWWIKLALDIHDHMAWHVVQELAFVLNYISISERLPTVFMPVSPPPYMNGGPDQFLSWVIESTEPGVDADEISRVLAGRLPSPVGDLARWPRCEGACTVPAVAGD